VFVPTQAGCGECFGVGEEGCDSPNATGIALSVPSVSCRLRILLSHLPSFFRLVIVVWIEEGRVREACRASRGRRGNGLRLKLSLSRWQDSGHGRSAEENGGASLPRGEGNTVFEPG
jgi:hypothetical protein